MSDAALADHVVGANLLDAIKCHGETVRSMAALTGVTPRTFRRRLRTGVNLYVEDIIRILEYLDAVEELGGLWCRSVAERRAYEQGRGYGARHERERIEDELERRGLAPIELPAARRWFGKPALRVV